MDYELAIEDAPSTVPGGTGVLLIHPSTGETDRIDTDFLKTDTDHLLVVSTDDLDGIVEVVEQFLEDHDGKLRLSFDSITELAYYADEERTRGAVEDVLALLAEYDAVGLFHLSDEVHDEPVLEGYRELFDGVITLTEDGTVTCEF